MKKISKGNGQKGKRKREHRIGLTLLYAAVVFCVLLITILISGLMMVLLARYEIITNNVTPGDQLVPFILYMSLISLIVGAIVSFATGKMPLKPIIRVADKMMELKQGNFSTRLKFGYPLNQHSTFKELAESFNTLAEELENTKLLRSDFVNNFSHEFKTPIVSIAGFAKLLKRGELTEEQKKDYLDIIEEEALRLSYMATNVLNLSKVENQTILTEVSAFNLSEQIRSAVLLLERQWTKKNIEFRLDFEEYNIEANEELLKQVWINLLDNAIKFSLEDGVIEVAIAEGESDFSICVSNFGEEIPPKSLDKIFHKFYQADESHHKEGNGVGLAIVSRIIELHQGKVEAFSGDGKTTFVVELPKEQQ